MAASAPRFRSIDSLVDNAAESSYIDDKCKAEEAMWPALPQMEIRFQNLSLRTEVKVATNDGGATHELPTIANEFKSKPTTKVTKYILHDVCGVFRPGTMTLVLGQPGSGKSSLLQFLSGRFTASKSVKIEGHVTYNGVSRDDLIERKRLPQFVSYVPQLDLHYPTMTVKEAFEFAHECCGSGLTATEEDYLSRHRAEEEKGALGAVQAIYGHYTEAVTEKLGLVHCQGTVIGDATLRGVSGGERKRVTMGEMEFGNRFVALMDEISTGLDSAATFDIVKTQRNLAKTLRKTIVMALLQPSPEVFDLFDDVMILNEGHVLYHGPCNQVIEYFSSLGLELPPDRDVADFLIDIGTARQVEYERGSNSYMTTARKPATLARTFRESSIFQSMWNELAQPVAEATKHDFVERLANTPEFYQSFWASTLTLLKREVSVTLRNKALMTGRVVLLAVVSFLDATLYFNVDMQNTQFTLGTIFGIFLYFTLNQPAMSAVFIKHREVFYKQRDANFFRTSSYTLAVALNQILLAVPDALILSTILYWSLDLVHDVWLFATFTLILLLLSLAFTSMTFAISSAASSQATSESVATLNVLIFTLFGGLFITHKQIPSYFQWAYWLNPLSWAMRSISISQYGHVSFDNCLYGGIDYCGRFQKKMGSYSLELYDIYTDDVWVWAGVAFLLGIFVLSFVGGSYALENVRHHGAAHAALENQASVQSNLTPFDNEGVDLSFDTTANESPTSHHIAVMSPRANRHVTPITLAFMGLRYSVPDPANKKGDRLELLKGISGFAKPGSITALMGSSGAGKTTLMDVIAGRKTGGKIEGRVLLNGYEADDISIRRSTGYCEQASATHSETATFREALAFSAFLRQDSKVSAEEKYDTVDECLELLNLRPIADKVVRGSSMEQLKRLSIGVELAAKQSVLFLDEPTSGLDARAAKVVMDAVRKVADSGRTVVCTIHQPSWEVFQLFDNMLLLKRGGEMVYFGEVGCGAKDLLQYFESIEGVAPCTQDYNPASWMLDVIGAGVNNSNSDEIDFVSIFQASKNEQLLEWQLNQPGFSAPAPGTPALEFSKKRAASNMAQMKWLLKRFVHTYWRSVEYNVGRIAVSLVLGLVFGLAFGSTDFETYQGVNTTATMVGLSSVFLGVVAFDSAIPFAFSDRASYYRERASQTYNTVWYWVGSTLIEIPYVFTMGLIFTAVFFPLAGFSGVLRFMSYWVHLSLHLLLQTFIGQAIAFATPSVEIATTFGLLVTSTSFLFMGFNPPSALIPAGYKWLNAGVSPKYTMAILTSLIFGDCSSASDLGCSQIKDAPPTFAPNITSATYLDEVFLIRYDDLWFNFGVILVYIAVVRVLGLLALRFVRHESR